MIIKITRFITDGLLKRLPETGVGCHMGKSGLSIFISECQSYAAEGGSCLMVTSAIVVF